MEDMATAIVLGVQALIWLAIIISLVYLIFRRIEVRKTEDFEHRDN